MGATVPPGLALATVLLGGLWLHVSALGSPFFADDYLYLDQVRFRSLIGALTSPDPLGDFFRPVGRQVYFWFVSRLGELPLVAHAINQILFIAIVVLLFRLARGLAGQRAALIAAAFLCLSHAFDVPLRWAAGSQDLLAVAGALAALCLVRSRHGRWAFVPLVLGLLAKETVVVTPAIALLIVRNRGESWKPGWIRVAPMAIATAAWAVVWTLRMQPGSRDLVHVGPEVVPAALAHFIQAVTGAEFGRDPLAFAKTLPPLVAIACVAVGILLIGRVPLPAAEKAGPEAPALPAWLIGLLWAGLATIPVAAVVHVWSAYYYLFALCGAALFLGEALGSRPAPVAIAVIGLLGWGSQGARDLPEFATRPDAWTTQSHVNRRYVERSIHWVDRYLDDLRRQHPSLPARSTLFFAGTPAFAAWQAGDGPLVRWAYRDSSLRSHYLSEFTVDRARRGPFFVFYARNDSLIEVPDTPDRLRNLALTQALSEHFAVAADAMTIAREAQPSDPALAYWKAWFLRALGDTAASDAELRQGGCVPRPGPAPDVEAARRFVTRGETAAATQALVAAIQSHGLDAEAHATLADLLLAPSPESSSGTIEALAARVLVPGDATAWRRWALIQARTQHPQEAYASLERYFDLAGVAGGADSEARALRDRLRPTLPGGADAQRYSGAAPRGGP